MTDVVRTQAGAEFEGLPGTRPLGNALVLSGPYNVSEAPNAYSFARSNTINIDASDWTAARTLALVEAAGRQAFLISFRIRDAIERRQEVHGPEHSDVNAGAGAELAVFGIAQDVAVRAELLGKFGKAQVTAKPCRPKVAAKTFQGTFNGKRRSFGQLAARRHGASWLPKAA